MNSPYIFSSTDSQTLDKEDYSKEPNYSSPTAALSETHIDVYWSPQKSEMNPHK